MQMHRVVRGFLALGGLMALAACADPISAPQQMVRPNTPSLLTNDPTSNPSATLAGQLWVCKDGNATGTFSFNYSVVRKLDGVTTQSGTASVAVGECKIIATVATNEDRKYDATVTEVAQANWALTGIEVVHGSGFNGPTEVIDVNAGTVSEARFGNDHGVVLKFTNLYTPPPPPPSGCTRTIGYWKTHAGFTGRNADVVSQYLSIDLGDQGGAKTVTIGTASEAVDALGFYGKASNGINKLYGQMLGAKLSIASGADGSSIAATITAADAFLATHDSADWGSLSAAQKTQVNGWMTTFDNYNNGKIGPKHCD